MTSPRALLLTLAGFILWASAFVAIYGLLSLGCRLDWHSMTIGGTTVQRVVLAAVLGIHLLALAGLTWWTYRRWHAEDDAGGRGRSFVASVSFYASAAALGATVFNFSAVFWLTSCETHQAAYYAF